MWVELLDQDSVLGNEVEPKYQLMTVKDQTISFQNMSNLFTCWVFSVNSKGRC